MEAEIVQNEVAEESKKKSGFTLFLDKLDWIDRALYGKRLKSFVWGAIIVVVVAPLIDYMIDPAKDRLTGIFTALFLLFIIILFVTWVSAWRDDAGNWTLKRAWFRVKSYGTDLMEFFTEHRGKSGEELLLKLGLILIFFGVCLKATQHASILYRKCVDFFGNFEMKRLRAIESFSFRYSLYIIIAGIMILVVQYFRNPKIIDHLWNEIKAAFGIHKKTGLSGKSIVPNYSVGSCELIIDSKDGKKLDDLAQKADSPQFNAFVESMKSWNPKGCRLEYEFEENLRRHLKKGGLSESLIETQKPLYDNAKHYANRRADIVIDDSILLELKRDKRVGELDRAKSQIDDYAEIWNDKGPVILVTCHLDYDHIEKHFSRRLEEISKREKNVLAIVVQKKT